MFHPNIILPLEIYRCILLHLPFKDVIRCMLVCKAWKRMLSTKSFWKSYIVKHFDLDVKSDISNEYPLATWASKASEKEYPESWYCYYNNRDDAYVIRPFPSMWNCGVIHPYGLDPLAGDAETIQGLIRSLEILTYMKSELVRLDINCGES
ncbi:uncharacterized protein LOC124449385 [Xenia sp. Carnegie-2017]|uniref:uncharacterized protein LOC124449385 n=1 Tax=Xenia sp. Carnegie-2017 TaxID=2897299 RepID=UPI001F0351DE|nr:uncharacterized protein LOC124449385 [Xenia sp. Carnegie-2017]